MWSRRLAGFDRLDRHAAAGRGLAVVAAAGLESSSRLIHTIELNFSFTARRFPLSPLHSGDFFRFDVIEGPY